MPVIYNGPAKKNKSVIQKIFKIVGIILLSIIILIFIFYIIYLFLLRPHKIKGPSMSPILENNVFVLANPSTYKISAPNRGDIVIYTPPDMDPNNKYISRIIGLPGERISIRNNNIYINGNILNEPYLAGGTVTKVDQFINSKDVLIPNGKYALLGDNREHSYDSRRFDFVERKNITELVFYIYWPKEKAKFIPKIAY